MTIKYPTTPEGFYVYILKIQQIPFYVGYGSGNRAHLHEQYARGEADLGYGLKEDYNPFKTRTIRKAIKSGHRIEYEFHRCESKSAAIELEIALIRRYGRKGIDENGLLTNRAEGGCGGNTWAHKRDEYIERLKQIWADPERRKRMAAKVKETRQRNGNWAQKWDNLSEEARAKIIASNRSQAKQQRKKVAQCDKETGAIIKVWDSAAEAAKHTGTSQGAISGAACGSQKTAGGFKWKHATDE